MERCDAAMADLEHRIAELERRFDEAAAREPDTFAQDFVTAVERRVFKLMAAALDAQAPGTSDVIRRQAVQLEEALVERQAEIYPPQVTEWMFVRASEIIDEMLPSPEGGEPRA